MNKRFFSKAFIFMLVMILLASCGGKKATEPAEEPAATEETTTEAETSGETESEEPAAEKKMVTVTTSFLYDMVYQLAGDLVERELIIPAGEDPHLYIAKPQDLEKLTAADLVLYHGLHFEGKMVDALEEVGHEVCANFPEEEIGKMEENGAEIIDPHFWFNVGLYKMAVENASAHLIELLPESKAVIEENTEKYLAALDEMHETAKAKMSEIPEDHRFLITPHDAFNYFSREYDIPVMAPQGVSTDSEVATKDIQETVDFIVEHQVKAIFAESTTDPARMEKLKEACKAQGFDVKVVSGEGHELFSDSLAPEGHDGDTYIDMYLHNVNLIYENLK